MSTLHTNRHSADIIRYTSCGYHCFRQCILKVRVRDGRIVSCEPDDTVNPGIPREDGSIPEERINWGMIQVRPCAKGYAQAQMVYDPARVKYPMKRTGQRGEGKFARISWEEALDVIAARLVETKKNYGPYSILNHPGTMLGNCGFPLAPWFGAGLSAWGGYSAGGWSQPEKWVLGRDVVQSTLHQDEAQVFNARLIVLWGLNPVSMLSGGWAYNLLRARERGIPIICIDSRYTPSAEVLADQWIPIRPTTDVAMMIAMANVWFKEDLCDHEFIRKWVEPDGFRRWRAYVLGAEDGIDKTPLWAESICGVPADTIEQFARLYAGSKPVNLNVSLSMGRQFYGENPTRASMYLQALTGNIGQPGATAAAETGWYNSGRPDLPVPRVDWQRKPGVYQPPVLLASFKWPRAIYLREKVDSGELSKEAFNNTIGNVEDNPAPDIRMVTLEGDNHLNNMPDINGTIRALKKVDFAVVFSQYADLPTARYADILLPQIYTAYEGRNCHGVDLFSERTSRARHFLYRQKCVEPVGEVRSHNWVWTNIARRLGIADLYNPRLVNVPDEHWDEAMEALHREAYEKWASRDDVATYHPPDWEEFQKKPVFRYEIKDPYYAFKKELESGQNPYEETDSGKFEFYSKTLALGADYLARHSYYPRGSGTCFGRGDLSPMAEMTMGGRDTFHSEDTLKYPLLMSSPHSLYRVHSFLDNNYLLKGDCYRHAVWINVADARLRGIRDNDMVRAYNDVGEMLIPAYVTSRVMPGTVVIFHGGWYRPGEDKSTLMPDGIDIGGAPNILTHNEDVPLRAIGIFPCKALVEIEKCEAA